MLKGIRGSKLLKRTVFVAKIWGRYTLLATQSGKNGQTALLSKGMESQARDRELTPLDPGPTLSIAPALILLFVRQVSLLKRVHVPFTWLGSSYFSATRGKERKD